jgi:hypothetical protein
MAVATRAPALRRCLAAREWSECEIRFGKLNLTLRFAIRGWL